MTDSVLVETARSCAMSICWLARWHRTQAPATAKVGEHVTARHPRPCAFCSTSLEKLMEAITTFRIVDGHDHVASADFERLAAYEQRRLVDSVLYPSNLAAAAPTPVEKSLAESTPPQDYVPSDLAPYGTPNEEPVDELAEAFA